MDFAISLYEQQKALEKKKILLVSLYRSVNICKSFINWIYPFNKKVSSSLTSLINIKLQDTYKIQKYRYCL